MLATAPDHRLHREQIQDLLWRELPPDSAPAAFRKALHHARHALEPELRPRGESAYLLLRDDLVSLSPSLVWIDADAFQVAAETALREVNQYGLEQALAAYGGELLPEDRYEGWSIGRRSTLAELHGRLLLALATTFERSGRVGEAIDYLRRVAALDPAQEEVHRRLMRLYAGAGHRHQALRQYQVCRDVIASELDAAPEPETEALYQELLAGRIGPEVGAPAVRPRTLRHPLPLPSAALRLATGPFVGRERVLGSLVDTLRRAEAGQGGATLVGGEAGIGKSRLVAELAREAHRRGVVVLWGAAYEQEGRLPYGALVEALDGAVADDTPDARQRLVESDPALAGFLPSLGPSPSAPRATGQVDASRTKLFAAVARLLEERCAGRPLLLVLDDLHAADAATLHLLHHLARLAVVRPWLIVGAYRAGEVEAGGDLSRLLTTMQRERLGQRLELGLLSREGCDRLAADVLAGGSVPTEVLDHLYARTLGNVFFFLELVQAMREEGALALRDGQWVVAEEGAGSIPRQVRELIEGRVDRLGEEGRRLLSLVAVAGLDCSFRLLRDAGDLPELALLDALDRALEAQLLAEHGVGYAFRHPLIRETVYGRLSGPRRARLHAALATAMERQTGSLAANQPELIEALAHHWTGAGEPGRALPYVVEAAERAARVYANDEAIARLRRALTLLDTAGELPDDRRYGRATILERLSDVHALMGETDKARDALLAALGIGDLEPIQDARLRRKCAQQTLFAGDQTTADDLLTQAAAGLGDGASGPDALLERARLLVAQAQADFLARRFADALAAGEESVALAEAAGSPIDVAQACEMVAMACLPLGDWQRGIEFERRHGELADLHQIVRDVSDVHLCLSEYHLYGEPAAEATRTFLRTLEESERIGAPRSLALCHYYLGTMAYFRGRFGDALMHLTESISLYQQVGSASGEAIARMMRGLTRTALGELEEGRQDLELGLGAAAHGTLRSHGMIRLYAMLGRNRLDANDPVAAREYTERGLALADEPSSCICYAVIHPIATAAFALTGDVERAAAHGDRALIQAQAINSPILLCLAHQANGILYATTGAWGLAFDTLDEARRIAEASQFPYELGRTLLVQAFVHMQRRSARDLARATVLTAEAWSILLRLGVRASAAQARTSMGFMRSQIGKRAGLAATAD